MSIQFLQSASQYAMFEPGTRNTGTAIAGKNLANPIAMLNASVDLLRHLGCIHHADAIEDSIIKTVTEDCVHTKDLGGNASSSDVVQNIIRRLSEKEIHW